MGNNPSSASNATGRQLRAQLKYFPQFLEMVNSNMAPTEMAKLAAAQQSAPGFAELGRGINTADRVAGTGADIAVLDGGGEELFQRILGMDREAQPEFYRGREAAGSKLVDLLDSYNMSGLSDGEAASVERRVNQGNVATGNAGTPSALTTVDNAMQFGDEFHKKQNSLINAIGAGSGLLQQTRSGIDPAQTVFGRPSQSSNPTQFAGIGQGVADMATNNYNKGADYMQMTQEVRAGNPTAIDYASSTPDY